jgi:hypothetical protein
LISQAALTIKKIGITGSGICSVVELGITGSIENKKGITGSIAQLNFGIIGSNKNMTGVSIY